MEINNLKFRKISKEEFCKLKDLFPGDEELWKEYRAIRESQFDNYEVDVFVIEDDGKFVGEITVNYVSHNLSSETFPHVRVYLEAFRLKKEYQGHGLGQELMLHTMSALENEGYSEFTIGVEDDNDVAKHIYFKHGFNEVIDEGHGDRFDNSSYKLYLRR